MSNDRDKVSYIGSGAAQEFFDRLPLDAAERQELSSRGLDRSTIEKLDYRTIDPATRVFESAWDEIKNAGLSYVTQGEEAPKHKGLLIPVYDFRGKIASFLVRRRNNTGDHKYIFLKTKTGKNRTCLHVPKEMPRSDVGKIILTEGVLKSDIVYALKGWPICGMHGLFLPKDGITALKEMGVIRVAIALDKEKKPATREARMALFDSLSEAGFDVSILTWEGGEKGIDDALVAGIMPRPMTDSEIESEKASLGRDIVYVQETDAFFYPSREDSTPYTRNQIRVYHGHSAKQFEAMLTGDAFDRVQKVVYDPSRPRGVYDDEYNTYSAPPNVDFDADDYRLVARAAIRHIKYLIPGVAERRIVIRWAASIVQNPGERHRWMLILFSESQQVGKGLIVNAFRRAIGDANWATLSNESITDPKATFDFFAKLVAQIEEIYHQDSYKVVNSLKERITEPQLRFEKKYMNAFTGKNTVNWLGLTNETDALKIDAADRRFCFIQCAEKRESDGYYREIADALSSDCAGSVLRSLLSRVPIDDYRAQTVAPETSTKELFVEATRTKGEDWFIRQVQMGKWPATERVLLVDDIQSEESLAPQDIRRASGKVIGKWLRSAGYQRIDVKRVLHYPPVKPGDAWIKGDEIRFRAWTRQAMTIDQVMDELYERGPEEGTHSATRKRRENPF